MSHKRDSFKKVIIILLVIAIVLGSLFAAGTLTDWFGFYGPGGKLMTASALAMASGNFTLQIDASVGSFEADDLLVKVDANLSHQEVTIAAMSKSGIISWAIYDAHLIWRSGFRYQAEDISQQLEQIWSAMDTGKLPDWEQLILDIDEALARKLEGIIDYDEITDSLIRLYKLSNDSGWLEDHAGLQVQKKFGSTCYRLRPDHYEILQEGARCFQTIFLEPQHYQQLQDTLSDLRSQLDTLDYQLDITTRWGILSQCELKSEVQGKDIGVHVQILDRNRTQLPEQELSEILSQLTSQ